MLCKGIKSSDGIWAYCQEKQLIVVASQAAKAATETMHAVQLNQQKRVMAKTQPKVKRQQGWHPSVVEVTFG